MGPEPYEKAGVNMDTIKIVRDQRFRDRGDSAP